MINSKDWSLSLYDYGEIVTDADDIIQCINILFTTQKKSDPFRPDFGIDLMRWLDAPVTEAAPGIVSEMFAALVYEPRVNVTAIVSKIEPAKVYFNIQGDVNNTRKQKINLTFLLLTEDGKLLLTESNNGIII